MTIFIDAVFPSIIDSYAGLVEAIGDWLDRSDLGPRIPDFIRMAEARFRRVLVMPDMEMTLSFPATASTAVPVDFDSMRSIAGGQCNRPLTEMAPTDFNNLRPCDSDDTRYYMLVNTQLMLWPTPVSTVAVSMIYRAKLPSLVTAETNWLLAAHPDAYLYASLVEAEGYLANDERIPNIKALLDEKIDEIMMAGQRKRYGAGPLVMRAGVTEGLRFRGYR